APISPRSRDRGAPSGLPAAHHAGPRLSTPTRANEYAEAGTGFCRPVAVKRLRFHRSVQGARLETSGRKPPAHRYGSLGSVLRERLAQSGLYQRPFELTRKGDSRIGKSLNR